MLTCKDKESSVKDDCREGVEGTKFTIPKKGTSFRCAAVLAVVVLLLSGVIVAATFLMGRNPSSTRLVEVKLEEGEVLVYQVEQRLEVQGGVLQKGQISTIVALQVKNKTSQGYWFILKIINITVRGENMDNVDGLKPGITNYFLIKFEPSSRSEIEEIPLPSATEESFHVYGHRTLQGEFTRYIHALLHQLLPTVERHLYELVDGENPHPNSELTPEESTMFPGPVKMHREANTTEAETLFVKNGFDYSDVTNVTSDVDLDMTYADSSMINRTNGVVTRGDVHVTEQLNFGEPIQLKNGTAVTKMKVTFDSYVTLLEISFDSEHIEDELLTDTALRDYVKLTAPKSDVDFTVRNQSDHEVLPEMNSRMDQHYPKQRGRRGSTDRCSVLKDNHQSTINRNAFFPTKKLFRKKLVGVLIQGDLDPRKQGRRLELDFVFRFGRNLREVKRIPLLSGGTNEAFLPLFRVSIPVLFIRLGVEFSLRVYVGKGSVYSYTKTSPYPKLELKTSPSVEFGASIHGYVSLYLIRAGVYGDGKFVRGNFPVKLSLDSSRPANRQLCLAVSADCRFLEIEAGVFYQWLKCSYRFPFSFRCGWGRRNIILRFGSWAAIRANYQLFEECYHNSVLYDTMATLSGCALA